MTHPKQTHEPKYKFALTISVKTTAILFAGFIIIGNPMHHRMSINTDRDNSINRPVEENGDIKTLVHGLNSGNRKHEFIPNDSTKVIPNTAKHILRSPMASMLVLPTANEAHETDEATINVTHTEYRFIVPLSMIGTSGCGGSDCGLPSLSFVAFSCSLNTISCIESGSSPNSASGAARSGEGGIMMTNQFPTFLMM
mmetsp:Transcript_4296/g.9381  ORF Transcript_4296/g.9381 Transcript_4296/m.9381 type:complete len:197 (-) Transcript_4296:205-795(-)